MERKWIEDFYKECGREVSLAYNVLNHSNNWGVTLTAAILATGFLGAIEINNGQITFHYPTIIHWFYIILAWIIMIRFFVRSALGLCNMYRWNTLIKASINILSLSEDNPYLAIFERNFAKKVDAYFYKWKSPKKRRYLIWRNLELMYLWFFLIILALFIWGLIILERNYLYWLGATIFLGAAIIESILFCNWKGFKYEELNLEHEPYIVDLWKGNINIKEIDPSKIIIMGFCKEGPYKHAATILENPEVKWIPWCYYTNEIESDIISDIASGCSCKEKKVVFSSWPKNYKGENEVLRFGRIDYLKLKGNCMHATIKLEDLNETTKRSKIKIENPQIFCFYYK